MDFLASFVPIFQSSLTRARLFCEAEKTEEGRSKVLVCYLNVANRRYFPVLPTTLSMVVALGPSTERRYFSLFLGRLFHQVR